MIANEQFSDINFMLIYVRYNAGPSVRNVPYNFKQDITELFLDYNLKIREMPDQNPNPRNPQRRGIRFTTNFETEILLFRKKTLDLSFDNRLTIFLSLAKIEEKSLSYLQSINLKSYFM